MKALFLLPTAFLFASSLLAQQPANSSGSELSKLRQGYVDSLRHLLQQCVHDHDVAAAVAVNSELGRMAVVIPDASPDMSACGVWTWLGNGRTTVAADQTAANSSGNKGIWHWVDEAKYGFQIEWQDGYVDTVTISPDGTKAHSVNNLDVRFAIERLPSPGKGVASITVK